MVIHTKEPRRGRVSKGCRLERKGMERKRMEWNEWNVMEWKGRVNGK